MSEPKCIAPLLENFIMGEAISEHNGVRSCPAMEKDTEGKYIVKILSIPASKVQLDALLLTGACSDEESAKAYFKELADNTVAEAELLQKLAGLEGFVGFDGWQIEPMEDSVGYDVYLLSSYRPTLERYLSRNPMTHLGAVNLGLDLCAALAVCRQSGYLYVALKPGNIYRTEKGDYRIGDLGFIPMDSLKYASLPDKYRSEYTAPEIADAYSALNETIDIYAVGLILYQSYNNGQLPQHVDGEALPAPEYADYEMAEIILKACDADPDMRWQSPAELGQALVGYMQRNSVNDTPIVPLPVSEEAEDAEQDEEPLENTESYEEEEITAVADLVEEDEPELTEDALDEEGELDQLEFSLTDETLPNEEIAEDLEDAQVTEEVSEMLAQADDLIAHETPDPVIPPDPIDVPMPPPIVTEEAAEETEPTEAENVSESEETAETVEVVASADDLIEDEIETEYVEPVKKSGKYRGVIITLSAILVVLILAIGAVLFYENYYIQSVENIILSGAEDYLTVKLDTDVDNSLLTVVCSDTHGNTKRESVTGNSAHFTGLAPDTQYKVTVEVSGFHKLIGTTTDSYSTDSRTDIVSFSAITGAEDGSVILSFVVQGSDDSAWRVTYSTAGEEEQSKEFTGHMVTINGLTVGSTYTFRIAPVAQTYLTGTDTLEHTASKLIYAENLTVHGFENGKLNASWTAPEGVTVESWTVRCYNDTGYDSTFTVTEPNISIADLSPESGYTLDVNAAGMSLGKRAFVSSGSYTVNNLTFDDSVAGELTVTWEYEGTHIENGWLLLYTVNGGEPQVAHSSNGVSAVIPSLVPGGEYAVNVQPPQGATVFGGTGTYTVPGGEPFSDYGTTAENITFRMCWTPDEVGWHWYDLWDSDFTTEFAVGEKASFVTHVNGGYTWSEDVIDVLFAIKDSTGTVLSIEHSSRPWSGICTEGYGELDMPTMPATPGTYTVDIYFNNSFVVTQTFTVME